VLLNEWVAVPRRIYTDGRGHPPAEDMLPSWEGHSIGHLEGDTLVVDTIGVNGRTRPLNGYFAGGVNATPESLKAPRLPSSDQMHLVERFRLVGNGTSGSDENRHGPEPTCARSERRFRNAARYRRAGVLRGQRHTRMKDVRMKSLQRWSSPRPALSCSIAGAHLLRDVRSSKDVTVEAVIRKCSYESACGCRSAKDERARNWSIESGAPA
jgi:hypothetical protein